MSKKFIEKNKNKLFIIIFFLTSIFLATNIINKNDSYEISSDERSNHKIIKSDILRFWNEADLIIDQIENRVPILETGKINIVSYLPSRIVATFFLITGEDIFLETKTNDGKYQVNSNNKKTFTKRRKIIRNNTWTRLSNGRRNIS